MWYVMFRPTQRFSRTKMHHFPPVSIPDQLLYILSEGDTEGWGREQGLWGCQYKAGGRNFSGQEGYWSCQKYFFKIKVWILECSDKYVCYLFNISGSMITLSTIGSSCLTCRRQPDMQIFPAMLAV